MFVWIFGFGFWSFASTAAAPRSPNIIFILADDLGCGDIGAFGQKKIRTPNLDRMAAEGMRFTQHYSGNAVREFPNYNGWQSVRMGASGRACAGI